MYTKLSAVAALVAATAFVVTGMASAGHTAAAHQRIAIVNQHGNSGAFVLTPLTSGAIERDSGTTTACCWTGQLSRRDGESIEIDTPLRTFVGSRGTFAWRARLVWVDLGSGYRIGTGTWKVVRGTGAYAGLEGHGRNALVSHGNDDLAGRAVGLLDLRG